MNLAETKEFVLSAIKLNLPVMLWGKPGIGKSELMAQIGQETSRRVVDVRLSQIEPIDLRGIPVTNDETKTTEYYIPSYMPTEDDEPGILFLDEINQGDQSTKAACYQLVLDRKLGEYRVPDGWVIIAAGNQASDKAMVGKLGTALTNRFIHGYVEAELGDFSAYAVDNDFHESIPAFLNFAPEYLHKMDTTQPDHPFSSPRTWEYVSNVMKAHPDSSITRSNLIKGAVGEGTGIVFLGYLDVYQRVPDWPQIIADPEGMTLNWNEMDLIYALAMKTIYNVSAVDIKPAMQFIERFPEEYQIMIMSIINKKKNHLWGTPEVMTWALAHQNSFK